MRDSQVFVDIPPPPLLLTRKLLPMSAGDMHSDTHGSTVFKRKNGETCAYQNGEWV